MYVNTTAEVKAETDYCCTSANAVKVVEHIYREHGDETEILFGPDMFLGAYVEKTLGRPMHVWDGECHVHAGIRPDDITAVRAAHPGADFLIHPECGCSTSVMEYVAAGDVDAEGVHMLSTGGMLRYAAEHRTPTTTARTAIVATETGMLYPLRTVAPDIEFIAANEAAHCRFMKMITLPKLRDALRDDVHEVKVPAEIAERARVPIERMVAISLTATPAAAATASRSRPSSATSRTARSVTRLRSNSARRVAVDVGAGAHLEPVPQRAGRGRRARATACRRTRRRRARRCTPGRARAAGARRARRRPARRRAAPPSIGHRSDTRRGTAAARPVDDSRRPVHDRHSSKSRSPRPSGRSTSAPSSSGGRR